MPAMAEIWELSVPRKLLVLCDSKLTGLELGLELMHWEKKVIPIDSNELNKTLDTVSALLSNFYEFGMDKTSVVAALGGGIVSDIAGFAAAVYMRGIDYINLPTTLLAQADSSIGGKTGVNLFGAKNILGAFHHPRLVYSNLSTLQTLSERDFISGLAEVIKCGIIKDRALLDELHKNKALVFERNLDTLEHIISRATRIKSAIVAEDERDMGTRRILNFGHTVGHALESLQNFQLPHGHAVALGMVCELDYSVQNLGLLQQDADFVISLIESCGLQVKHSLPTPEKIYQQMLKDKKSEQGKITIIGIPALGRAKVVKDIPKETIIKSLERLT